MRNKRLQGNKVSSREEKSTEGIEKNRSARAQQNQVGEAGTRITEKAQKTQTCDVKKSAQL